MSLFFLLIIPVVIGLAGLLIWREEITWREFLAQEVAVVIFILVAFFVSAFAKTSDKEIWNGVIADKKRTSVSCSESYQCNCHQSCSGSGSSRSCSQVCSTCWRYWTVTNWHAKTSNGETAYDAGTCHNDKPREPERYTAIKIGEPTAIEHGYTNYIKGNPDTIIKRTDVNKNFNIPAYPKVYDWYRVERFIFTGVIEPKLKEYNEKLDKLNAELGSLKQVNIIVLVTNETDQLYVEKVKEQWIGGKKNDFIVVIGAPNYPKIEWSQVVSWSDSEDAKVFTKNRIMEIGVFDVDKVLGIIKEEVSQKYVRKEMKDFEYLKARIEPSRTMQIIIFVVSILSSIGLTYWFKKEDIL
jgi:hypothetical protein